MFIRGMLLRQPAETVLSATSPAIASEDACLDSIDCRIFATFHLGVEKT